MSKLSNTDKITAAMSPYDYKVNEIMAATECHINDQDVIMWHGIAIGILSSMGDWVTGEVEEYIFITIRGLPIEKEVMTYCVIHGVTVKTSDTRQQKGYWHR